MPFKMHALSNQEETNSVLEESEEMKELKMKLTKVESEKSSLEAELIEVRSASKALKLKLKNNEKTRLLERSNKRVGTWKAYMDRTKVCLRSPNMESGLRNVEQNKAMKENQQLRKAQVEMRQQLNTFTSLMEEQEAMRRVDEQAFEEAIRGYEEHLEKKHREVEELLKGKEDLQIENWQLKGEMVNFEAAIRRGYEEHLEKKHREVVELLKGKEDLLIENWQLKGEMVNFEAARAEFMEEVRKLIKPT